MRKRLSITVLAVALVALIAVGGTLAFNTSEATVTNQITTGSVRITLTEPDFSSATGGTLNLEHVTPGQVIHKDPTITNSGERDVYVRCKVSADALTPEQQSALLGGSIDGDLWYHADDDGYYYYKNILPSDPAGGNTVPLFTSLTVPSDWGSEMAGESFDVSIAAEAIQADDFTPATDASGNITGWTYAHGLDAGKPVPVPAERAAPLP